MSNLHYVVVGQSIIILAIVCYIIILWRDVVGLAKLASLLDTRRRCLIDYRRSFILRRGLQEKRRLV